MGWEAPSVGSCLSFAYNPDSRTCEPVRIQSVSDYFAPTPPDSASALSARQDSGLLRRLAHQPARARRVRARRATVRRQLGSRSLFTGIAAEEKNREQTNSLCPLGTKDLSLDT